MSVLQHAICTAIYAEWHVTEAKEVVKLILNHPLFDGKLQLLEHVNEEGDSAYHMARESDVFADCLDWFMWEGQKPLNRSRHTCAACGKRSECGQRFSKCGRCK